MSTAIRPAAPRLRRPAADGDRPPVRVLLLHGMGAGVGSWGALDRLLAPHRELWDAALPWSLTGDPDWVREPDVTRWVAAPVAHMVAAGHAPDAVVAHSFAANVLLELLTRSDLLARTPVVLVMPFYRGAGADLDWASIVPAFAACFSGVAEEIQRRSARLGTGAVICRLLELMGAQAPLRLYEVYRRTPDLDLESLSMPLLLVGGGKDNIAYSAEGVRVLAERIPHARAEVLGDCGHFPMTEEAPELAALIESFI